jgi:hypothetical protein
VGWANAKPEWAAKAIAATPIYRFIGITPFELRIAINQARRMLFHPSRGPGRGDARAAIVEASEAAGQLSQALLRVQGRFILRLNDVAEVRSLFAWASVETVDLSYQAGGAEHAKRVRELIISTPR